MNCSCKLTVLFENQFWVGIFEIMENEQLTVSRVIFGAEPREIELLDFIHTNYYKLTFGKAVTCEQAPPRPVNPKRLQRLVQREVEQRGIGTKAQQALKATQELVKIERKVKRRETLEADAERKFQLKQEKRKQKHRGH